MSAEETKSDDAKRDEASIRIDTDPAAQVAAELRARLRAMAAPELIELAAQLLTTYVIESVIPLARAGEGANLAADTGGEESFAQMLKRLKASKRDPVLEKFLIDGENISVRIDGYGVLPLTDYRRPNAPSAPAAPGATPAPPQPRRESVPGASTSIYNRALYQPDQAPSAPPGAAPARGAPRPAPAANPPATPAAAGQAQPGAKKDEAVKNDRFALIELD